MDAFILRSIYYMSEKLARVREQRLKHNGNALRELKKRIGLVDVKKAGFTLVELLVVVSIISLLTSIVLAALTTARNKGSDAAMKSNLLTIRTQTGLYRENNGNFGSDYSNSNPSIPATCDPASMAATVMFRDPVITNAMSAIRNINGAWPTCAADDGIAVPGTAATSWAVSAPLRGGGNWCVDVNAASKAGTATIISGIAFCN